MNNIKMYLTWIGIFVVYMLLISIILTTLNYFHIVYSKGSSVISLISMIIIFGIIGFKFGKRAIKKGYLEGIKIGSSLIFLFVVINILFFRDFFHFEQLIYYVVLLLSSTLGSMIGISNKG